MPASQQQMPISRLAVDAAKNDTLNTRGGDCGDLHFATNSEAKKQRAGGAEERGIDSLKCQKRTVFQQQFPSSNTGLRRHVAIVSFSSVSFSAIGNDFSDITRCFPTNGSWWCLWHPLLSYILSLSPPPSPPLYKKKKKN